MKKKVVKKSTHGGARPNSGPKPKEKGLLKKTLFLYVVQNDIDKLGGESAVKERCYAVIKETAAALT